MKISPKIVTLAILCLLLTGVVGCANAPEESVTSEPTLPPTEAAPSATAVVIAQNSPTPQPSFTPRPTVPPPATVTPPPTATATATPAATDTPTPTDTPTATSTAVPTRIILPTNTPTSVPTPEGFGLFANMLVEGGPVFATNQDIWFQFDLRNPNRTQLEYGGLGIFPRKDGVDRLDMFQYSWSNATMFPDGFTWRDHINIGEPGDYTLRVAICYNGDLNACKNGGGTWVTLSDEYVVWVR